MKTYTFEISGGAANGQTWQTSGAIIDERNDVLAVFDSALSDTFRQLTHGNAVFGKPGIGCVGPYTIEQIRITLQH